jgi:hypothetical protein
MLSIKLKQRGREEEKAPAKRSILRDLWHNSSPVVTYTVSKNSRHTKSCFIVKVED